MPIRPTRINENVPAGTEVFSAGKRGATYSLGGEDAGDFEISADGKVTLKASPDFEHKASYSFEVTVTTAKGVSTLPVLLEVRNLNDNAPEITSASVGEVQAHSSAGTVIYTATATDADGPGRLRFRLEGEDAALLNIDATGRVLLRSAAGESGSYSFVVVATDGKFTDTQAVELHVDAHPGVAPTLAITSSADILQDGESATVTFSFSEDPGASFTDADVMVAGGTLSALQGSGLVRTATFTAAAGSTLTTGGKVSVLPSSFSDAGGNTGEGSVPVGVRMDTVFNEVLFVGNSATFGRADPVMRYNTYDADSNPGGVHDMTAPVEGTSFADLEGANLYEPHDWGGVPGLVDMFAAQVGLSYDISLSTRNAATLRGHYLNTNPADWDLRGNIASQEWDMVVLQDQTDEPLPGGSGSITFAAGKSTATLVVTPRSDSVKEYDETLGLKLSTSANYTVGTSGTQTATILNDDPNAPSSNPALPTVTLVATQGSAAEDGNSNLVWTFTRTGSTDGALTVTFSTARGGGTTPSVSTQDLSAQDFEMYMPGTGVKVASQSGMSPYRWTAGNGWLTDADTGPNSTTATITFNSPNRGTIVIPAGQTSASLTLDPRADVTVEGDETIRLGLVHADAVNPIYNLGTSGTVAGTIVNDDIVGSTLPNVTLSLGSATAYESSGQSFVYTFTRSGSNANELTVNFSADGTATWFQDTPAKSDFSISSTGASAASLTTTSGSNADIAAFRTYATLIENYIHEGDTDPNVPANANANPDADVYLYATWARPDMVAGAWDMLTAKTLDPDTKGWLGGEVSRTDTQAVAYYLDLESMSEDLTEAYENLAQVNPDFVGVAPVSTAFMNAVLQGIAIRDPYTETATGSVSGDGTVNLWFEDNLHASKYGSYLAGLTLFETLTGIDARALGAGDVVAADLGIDAATAVALQQVASATLGFDQDLHWSGPGAVTDLANGGASAMLAAAGGYTFVDATHDAHEVSVQPHAGNLGTLEAVVRSDGHAGQVNWLYTVDNADIDLLLTPGAQRVEYFTLTLDDGNGNTSAEIVGVTLTGGVAA